MDAVGVLLDAPFLPEKDQFRFVSLAHIISTKVSGTVCPPSCGPTTYLKTISQQFSGLCPYHPPG